MDNKINIFCEDCMNISIPKCRLLLTDIPYEVVNRSDNGLRNLNKGLADKKTFEILDFLDHIYDSFDIAIIFCAKEQLSEIYEYFNEKQNKKLGTVRQIVWCKSNPSPMNGEYVYLSGTENAVWFKKAKTGKLNAKCKKNWFVYPVGKSRLHPTEKNHDLLAELIVDNTNIGDLVADPCMGSGSTGLIAAKLNRDFWGTEIDKNYFNVASNRLTQE